jgi:hypothetical protein
VFDPLAQLAVLHAPPAPPRSCRMREHEEQALLACNRGRMGGGQGAQRLSA